MANRSHVFIENSIRSNCISNSISFSRVLVGVPGDLAFPFWHPVFLVRSAERNVAPCTVNVTKNASLRRRGTLENEQRWKKEESRWNTAASSEIDSQKCCMEIVTLEINLEDPYISNELFNDFLRFDRWNMHNLTFNGIASWRYNNALSRVFNTTEVRGKYNL